MCCCLWVADLCGGVLLFDLICVIYGVCLFCILNDCL